MLDGLRQDLRFGTRSLLRNPGFLAAAVLIIALGVGANTAVFSVAHALLLKPLPFEEPERLVWIANDGEGGMSAVTSRTGNLRDFQAMNESFEQIGGYFAFFDYGSLNLAGRGEPRRLVGVGITEEFLPVLGVEPMLGRNFAPEECVWNGRPAVLLTYQLWQNVFSGDPDIVGQAIDLNNESRTVVGVMPKDFDFAQYFSPTSRIDLLTPFPVAEETDRWGNTLAMIGRLKPGVTPEQAEAELGVIIDGLQRAEPARWGLGAVVSPLREKLTGEFRPAVLLLAGAVGLVLLIVCTNLSNLLLARASSRRKEIAVRAALGAGRRRLVQQTLTESLILAAAGGVLGVAFAWFAVEAVAAGSGVRIPLLASVEIDGAVLAFTLGVTLLTGLLFGIVPALQLSMGDSEPALKESGRGTSHGKGKAWLRDALVVSEVALAGVLLVGAGLLMRSFVSLLDADPGFQAEQAAAWRIETGESLRDDAGAQADFYARLVRSVESIPGVEAAGVSDTLPLGRNRSWNVRAQGVDYAAGEAPNLFPRIVDSGYLEAMKIPLVSGRFINDQDAQPGRSSIVLSSSAAKALWPDQDPLGQTALVNGGEYEVVGVVADVRHQSLESAGGMEIYFPIQRDGIGARSVDLVVRSNLPVETLAPAMRRAIREADPLIPAGDYRELTTLIDEAVSPRRFLLWLLGAFAVSALVLACLGIYGVISYGVNQRRQEFGIRMALGASAATIRGGVLKGTLRLAGIGLAIGLVGAVALVQLVSSMLYGVAPRDPLTFLATAAVLAVVALIAGYLPARRASLIAPSTALRAG